MDAQPDEIGFRRFQRRRTGAVQAQQSLTIVVALASALPFLPPAAFLLLSLVSLPDRTVLPRRAYPARDWVRRGE